VEAWNPDAWRSEVETMTAMLRSNEEFPMWSELRAELRKLGVDPDQALLVESYEEEPPGGGEVGVVVAAPERVLVYRIQRGVWSWEDSSDGWESSDFADQVRVGLELAAEAVQ
jgi:hypothetical protein